MATKICTKCGGEFDLDTGFYHDRKTPDGFFYQCKICTEARNKRWRARPEVHKREMRRLRKVYATHREQYRARAIANAAAKRGELKRGPCEVCGSTIGVQMHHDDHSKPLEIHDLCRKHHAERDRQLKLVAALAVAA